MREANFDSTIYNILTVGTRQISYQGLSTVFFSSFLMLGGFEPCRNLCEALGTMLLLRYSSKRRLMARDNLKQEKREGGILRDCRVNHMRAYARGHAEALFFDNFYPLGLVGARTII